MKTTNSLSLTLLPCRRKNTVKQALIAYKHLFMNLSFMLSQVLTFFAFSGIPLTTCMKSSLTRSKFLFQVKNTLQKRNLGLIHPLNGISWTKICLLEVFNWRICPWIFALKHIKTKNHSICVLKGNTVLVKRKLFWYIQ
jgi:hypothetical protein